MPTVPKPSGNVVQGPMPKVAPAYMQMAQAMELQQRQEEQFQQVLKESDPDIVNQRNQDERTRRLDRYPMLRDRMRASDEDNWTYDDEGNQLYGRFPKDR